MKIVEHLATGKNIVKDVISLNIDIILNKNIILERILNNSWNKFVYLINVKNNGIMG